MARRPKKNVGPHSYQRGNRWYADFRGVGGGREPLAEPGSKWGTKDEEIAEVLFLQRLTQLQDEKRGKLGVERKDRSTTLAELVQHHLLKKNEAGKTSYSHMDHLEQRLGVAIEYFGEGRDPRTIEPAEVSKWAKALAKDGTRTPRTPGTVRHYLNALGGLYRRAQEGLWVAPGYNPVAAMMEKPSGYRRGEAEYMEMADAALYLEAARLLDGKDRRWPGLADNRVNATPGWYPIVATFLLTGGRRSEIMGLTVEDVSFDRGEIHFRPNAHRGLKTETSIRTVPLWPQLREILQDWMFGGDTPHTAGLLFPSVDGGMVHDIRKSLDATARRCGIEGGRMRTRPFRHTYCSARLQTVQRILKPGGDPSDTTAWEYIEVSKFQVQKEMGHGGSQLVDRIYGHAQKNPIRSDVVEYRVEQHQEALGDRLRSLVAAA